MESVAVILYSRNYIWFETYFTTVKKGESNLIERSPQISGIFWSFNGNVIVR